jgi:signal transduction histidine kinase
MPAPEALYERLRILAVKDPKEARKLFLAAFESNSTELHSFFAILARPNEGRLRQLVANALKNHPEKRRIVNELFRWREAETDEFARRAIEGALADVEPRYGREARTEWDIPRPSEVGDVYRYVASRLRHRLGNFMLPAQAQASQLRKLVPTGLGMDIQTVIAKLNDAMISMGRALEATDVDPDFFRQRSIALADWLRQMNVRYTAQYTAIDVKLLNEDAESVRVFANDYLLETVFWNIWVNAQQATGPHCELIINFKTRDKNVELRILDNGGGFTSDLKDIVFQQVYSTRSSSRGRGLLEIQDAVEQLGGHVELYEARPLEYRILIRLPLDRQ